MLYMAQAFYIHSRELIHMHTQRKERKVLHKKRLYNHVVCLINNTVISHGAVPGVLWGSPWDSPKGIFPNMPYMGTK